MRATPGLLIPSLYSAAGKNWMLPMENTQYRRRLPYLLCEEILRQSLISDIRETHRVGSPGVDIHRSLAAGCLYQGLLAAANFVMVDRDELDLDWDIARIVSGRAGWITDVHHFLSIRRNVGKPVLQFVVHNPHCLLIVETRAVRRKSPDGFLP